VHTIRALEEGDWENWKSLWAAYLDFYRAELSEETTLSTFDRLTRDSGDMFALLAVGEQGEGTGLLHCVVHPTTWSRRPSRPPHEARTWVDGSLTRPSRRRLQEGRDAFIGILRSTMGGHARSTTRWLDQLRSSSTKCKSVPPGGERGRMRACQICAPW
jgi:hypothetical protein